MKTESPGHMASASRDKPEIWDDFRHDHELIERLRITPHEIDTLAHCALLGTLTSKQDLLFILRQIREATRPVSAEELVELKPVAEPENFPEEPIQPVIRTQSRVAHGAPSLTEPGSLEAIVRRRLPEQLGISFWSLVLTGGLIWNLAIPIYHRREHIIASFGAAAAPKSLQSVSWLARLDGLSVLIGWEILFVGCILIVVLVRSRTRHRRLKIRPS